MKKKVLHIIADLGNGGAERQLVEILKGNSRQTLCILKSASVYKKDLISNNIEYYELNFRNIFSIIIGYMKIVKVISYVSPDVVQAWMYNSCLVALFVKLFCKKKFFLIWSIRCSNMILKYYSISLRLSFYLCKIFSKRAHMIIYNSYSGFKYHQKLGFKNKRSKVILNGTNENIFLYSKYQKNHFRKKFKLKNSDIVLLCVARHDPMKGHDILLKGFEVARKKNKSLKLVLIGKNTDRLSRNENIIALGMIKDIEKYYSFADFIILTSRFGEGFSNVLVEGMLSRLVPISTDVGDAEIIIKRTGFVFPSNSLDSLINVLNKVSNLSRKQISSLSSFAKRRALNNFTTKKMIQSYIETYKELK